MNPGPGRIDPFDPPKAQLLGLIGSLLVIMSGNMSALLPDAVFITLAAHVIAWRKEVPLAEAFSVRPAPRNALAFPIALGFVVTSTEVLILDGIDLLTGGALSRWSELFESPLPSQSILVNLLIAAVLVPVAEELYFRGFFQGALKPLGYGWSVFIPSLFFASLHHPLGMPGAFVIAVSAGILTAKYGSVIPALVFHSSVNAWLTLVGQIQELNQGLGGLIAYFVICVAGVLLVFRIRPELSQLWSEWKLAWTDFRSRQSLVQNSKALFKHWSYILLILFTLLTLALIIRTSFTHS